MKQLRLWYERVFKIISMQRAKELNLTFIRNVYGDQINKINCRSLWVDEKGRSYRVEHLNQLKTQDEKYKECLYNCLQILEQTKVHRKSFNLTGGDIFLDSTIDQAKQLLNQE